MTIKECKRCNFRNPQGKKCKRITCKIGPYCAQHTKIKYGVAVKKSEVLKKIDPKALGLFAVRGKKKKVNGKYKNADESIAFKPEERIAPYKGEIYKGITENKIPNKTYVLSF